MRGVLLFCTILLPACLDLIPQSGGDDESADAAAAADGSPALSGIDCIAEGTTGETICSGISACPDLFVDHDIFPTCGFRPAAGVLDLECACSASLCPIGIATSCDEARRLMNGQTQFSVCAQEYEGRCAEKRGATTKQCDEECHIRCSPTDEGCPRRCGCAQ